MAKKTSRKFSVPRTPFKVLDVPAEEKKNMMEFFRRKGMSSSTYYLRFFQKGFDNWEIEGVDACKRQFLDLPDVAKALLEYEDKGDVSPSEKGYLYVLAQSDKPGVFYSCLKQVGCGLCTKFFAYMSDRGMSSTTVIKRFVLDEWKEWEREGINNLLEKFYNR